MSSTDTLISIIVPAYNCEDCLERCITSLSRQTYENIEIIIVNDGSTDKTSEVCTSLKASDSRIRTMQKANGGTSSARNVGIECAKGSYLGFVDSDDYVEPYVYEKLLNAINDNSVRISQISRDELNSDGSRRDNVCTPPEKLTLVSSEEFLKSLLMHKGDCSFCTKLVSRDLFTGKRFPEGELNEDFKLLVNMLSEAGDIAILPEQGYHVVYSDNSNTRKSNGEFSQVYTDIVNNADWVQRIVDTKYKDGAAGSLKKCTGSELHEIAMRFGFVQRLDYMLHIPIEQMKRSNTFYISVCTYLRAHYLDICSNAYLTDKQRLYLKLLAKAPVAVRKAHRMKMNLGGKM